MTISEIKLRALYVTSILVFVATSLLCRPSTGPLMFQSVTACCTGPVLCQCPIPVLNHYHSSVVPVRGQYSIPVLAQYCANALCQYWTTTIPVYCQYWASTACRYWPSTGPLPFQYWPSTVCRYRPNSQPLCRTVLDQ